MWYIEIKKEKDFFEFINLMEIEVNIIKFFYNVLKNR